MRRRSLLGTLGFVAFSLVTCILVAALCLGIYGEVKDIRKQEASHLLSFYQETMTLKLHGDLSATSELAAAFSTDPTDTEWFSSVSEELLAHDEVVYVAYVEGETMRYAYPEEFFGDRVGKDLTDFMYIYTLAKVTDDFVIEGPMDLPTGDTAYVFVEPVNVDGAYYGQVIVGLRADYVIEQLNFTVLEEDGFCYELWAVSPQDGSKNIVSASEGEHDFSQAVKLSFNMPTLWTLSIMPHDGWVPSLWTNAIVAGGIVVAVLIIGTAGFFCRARGLRKQLEEERRLDHETGLLSYSGFVERLQAKAGQQGGRQPLTIVCLMVDDFEQTALSLGWDARHRYLVNAGAEIDSVVQGVHFAARMGSGCFAIALEEHVDRRTLMSLMRALELGLLWKVRIEGKKVFCRARSAAVYYPEDGDDPVALVERTISLLERDKPDAFERKRSAAL